MRVENWPIEKLTPYARNPRKNEHAVLKVAASIKEYGWRQPIVVDKDGVVVAGHTRLLAAMHLQQKTVPVHIADELNPIQVKAYRLADNRVAQEAEWDDELLALEIEELQALGLSDLDSLGFEEEELAGLHIPELEETEGLTDPDEVPEPPADPITKPGDLWLLGRHRLLCGDSTKAEDVARLMDGERADMVFTDPPYGVNIKGGANQINSIAGDITQTAIPFSFELAVENATKEKGRLYFCGGEGNIHLYQKLFERYCRQLPRHLIWVKESFVMKPNGYHNQYEFIFHGFKAGGGSLDSWFGGRTEHEASDVWQLKRDNRNDYLHPTQKPVELPARAITNSSPLNGIVYEPFSGSGSTLIAAEKTGRKCYGMELDPKYCDVIVKRWEDFTGKKAVLADG